MKKNSGMLERGVTLVTIGLSVLFFGLIIGAPQIDPYEEEIALSKAEILCGGAESLVWEENVPGFSIVENTRQCSNGAREASEKLALTHSLLEKRCETAPGYEWRQNKIPQSSCVAADDNSFAVSISETLGACCQVL